MCLSVRVIAWVKVLVLKSKSLMYVKLKCVLSSKMEEKGQYGLLFIVSAANYINSGTIYACEEQEAFKNRMAREIAK